MEITVHLFNLFVRNTSIGKILLYEKVMNLLSLLFDEYFFFKKILSNIWLLPYELKEKKRKRHFLTAKAYAWLYTIFRSVFEKNFVDQFWLLADRVISNTVDLVISEPTTYCLPVYISSIELSISRYHSDGHGTLQAIKVFYHVLLPNQKRRIY